LNIPEYSSRITIFLLKFWFFEISTFLQIVQIVLKLLRYYDTFTHLRGSLLVLSMWLQTVKFIATKSKCASLAEEIGFSASNSCSLPWLVKGARQLCTFKKEYNKLDLTVAQYFWLVDHNDWSRWFAISNPHVDAIPVTVSWVGLPNKNS